MEPSNPTGHTTGARNETLLDAMTQVRPGSFLKPAVHVVKKPSRLRCTVRSPYRTIAAPLRDHRGEAVR